MAFLTRARSLLVTTLLLPALVPPAAAGTEFVDVGRGPVAVVVPSSYDPRYPMPLVVLLHGYGGNPMFDENYFRLAPLAEAYGFLYAMPSGTIDITGNRFWNGTDASCDLYGTGVDDSGYLRALVEELRYDYTVDARRIYFVGHSNGGFMAYRMARDHADIVAGIVSLAGATFANTRDVIPSDPVHVLQVHGTLDNTVLYDGGVILAPYPGALTSAQTWAAYDGCALTRVGSPTVLDVDANIPGVETTVTLFESACQEGGSAQLWSIVGSGHWPALTNEFRTGIVDWMLSHPKAGVGTALCHGDGRAAACPCGNDSPVLERGCLTSNGTGMWISGSGSTSIAADDLTLTAHDIPLNNSGLFYIGWSSVAPGSFLFDGFQCAGGITMRMPGHFVTTGTIEQTGFVAQDIFNLFWIPGQSYFFQYYSRDTITGSSPCGGLANLSSAFAVTMTP